MKELSINLILANKLGLPQATLIAYFISLQGNDTRFTITTKEITQILPFGQSTVRKLIAGFRIAGLLTVTRDKNGNHNFTVNKDALDAIINPKDDDVKPLPPDFSAN
jgi:hypothetical protein